MEHTDTNVIQQGSLEPPTDTMSDEWVWLAAAGEPHFTDHLSLRLERSPWSTGKVQYECRVVSDTEGSDWQVDVYSCKINTWISIIG